MCYYNTLFLLSVKALVGVSFSLGFLFGPMIGAMFSVMGKNYGEAGSFTMFQYPAVFALTLAVLDIVFIAAFFTETLPLQNRVTGRNASTYFPFSHHKLVIFI